MPINPEDLAGPLSEDDYNRLSDDEKEGYEPITLYKPKGFKAITKGPAAGRFVPAQSHDTSSDCETCLLEIPQDS